MNMFITAAISNSEFITNSNSRCEVFEYFSSVNINFDILNTINSYIQYICKSICSYSEDFNCENCDTLKSDYISHINSLILILHKIITHDNIFNPIQTSTSESNLTKTYKNTTKGILCANQKESCVEEKLPLYMKMVEEEKYILDLKKSYLFMISIIFSRLDLLNTLFEIRSKSIDAITDNCIIKTMILILILRYEMKKLNLYVCEEIYYIQHDIAININIYALLYNDVDYSYEYITHLKNCIAEYNNELNNSIRNNLDKMTIQNIYHFIIKKQMTCEDTIQMPSFLN
ncbi:hypothetical protein TCON_2714 [Astathelohania contejeani]|uniref:Uncharacterized protein n=1 Tax=Astathelohania contejeani TaxID=164912 RepID=A0ABQ7HV87_9MICR|nr:hypothetical protein TCON_2714 [Thelohania contejeani]